MARTIKEFAVERGVKSLFHFTRVKNLPSILARGLLTKKACNAEGVEPEINDQYRYDGTDAVCATISYPNYRMFYRLRCDNPGVEWVVIKLDCSLLWRTPCAFSDTNAGDGSVFHTPVDQRQGLASLKSMFGDYQQVERAILKIPDHYTTNPQAEVLLLDGAASSDITGVYFQTNARYVEFKAQYPDLRCHLNGGFFNGRSDYAHWK